jgi:protein-S-isoprenylcysteine O-methyltransferase Ste14
VRTHTAWSLVVIQFVLLAALLIVPRGSLWPEGAIWWTIAVILIVSGAVLGAASGVRLGRNLTPNPIPREEGTLVDQGVYRWVRHPMYAAVLLLALGLTTLKASLVHLLIFFALVMLLWVKARAEERLLREKFEHYRGYQARVGMFFPRVFSRQ